MPRRYLDSMKGKQFSNKRTICEVHREIYDILILEFAKSKPDIVEMLSDLLEEAFLMGIKLCEKLISYKLDLEFDNDVQNPEEIKRLREERERLIDMTKLKGEKNG